MDKNSPSPTWLAALRRRLPCEPEIDAVLTRKMERRAGSAYAPIALNSARERLLHDRVWLLPQGWEAQAQALPPLDELLSPLSMRRNTNSKF